MGIQRKKLKSSSRSELQLVFTVWFVGVQRAERGLMCCSCLGSNPISHKIKTRLHARTACEMRPRLEPTSPPGETSKRVCSSQNNLSASVPARPIMVKAERIFEPTTTRWRADIKLFKTVSQRGQKVINSDSLCHSGTTTHQ